MSLYRDFDLMDIDANGVWTNENDPTAINIALRHAESAPAFSLAIPARIPDLSPGHRFRQHVLHRRRARRKTQPASRRRPPILSTTSPHSNQRPRARARRSRSCSTRSRLSPPHRRPLPVPLPRPGRLRKTIRLARRLLGPGRAAWRCSACIGYFGSLSAWTGSSSDRRPLALRSSQGHASNHRHRARQPRKLRHRRRHLRGQRQPDQDHQPCARGDQGQEGRHRLQVRLLRDRQEHSPSRISRSSRPSPRSRPRSKRWKSSATRAKATSSPPRSR